MGKQVMIVWNAPFPFLVVTAVVAFAIWKIFAWRYDAIIERLRDERDGLKAKLAEDAPEQSPLAPQPLFGDSFARAETGGQIHLGNIHFGEPPRGD